MLTLVLPACGPTVGLEIGVKERPVDVKFEGELPLEPVRPEPSVSRPGTSSPGFIAAPVELGPRRAIDIPASRPSCPTANGQLAAEELAPPMLTQPPREGVYTFRRVGTITFLGATYDLGPVVVREIKDVQVAHNATGQASQYRYKQVETAPGIATTTTYRIDQPVIAPDGTVLATGGMYIEQIVTERMFATTAPELAKNMVGAGNQNTETFTPSPPVQIADLPFAEQGPTPPRLGGGVDPLNGTAMNVRYRTIGHKRIDACGKVFDAWDIEIHPDSRFVNSAIRKYQFDGHFAVAPQLGGLIVAEQIHFAGDDFTIPYDMRTAATINNITPEKRGS